MTMNQQLQRRATWTGYRGLGSLAPLELLTINARDLDLDNCGGPVNPDNGLYVEFPKCYLFTLAWTTSASEQFFLDERRTVDTGADFILDRIAMTGSPVGARIRFIWDNGRFSANTRIPLLDYCDNGDDTIAIPDGLVIPGGKWIGVEASIDAGTAAGSLTVGFEGRVRYYLTRGKGQGR